MFDPDDYATQRSVPVITVPIPENGRFYLDFGVILLRPDLDPITRRCVLAHELAHHHYGDGHSTPKIETRANKWAANHLLTARQIADCARVWPENPEKWCLELAVTSMTLRAWLDQPDNYQAAKELWHG